MAVTGLIMVGFLLTHVAANLLVFAGPTALDEYAVGLRKLGPLLWVARIGLIVAVILHIDAAAKLTLRKNAARPVNYRGRDPQVSTWGARTIRIGGVVLLLFIVYHLLHMTFGTVHPDFIHLRPFRNVMIGFQSLWVVLFYLVAMAFLGLHFYHGVWSSLRTMGLARPSDDPLKRRATAALAVAIWLGFSVIPVAVYLGLVG